MKVYFPGKRVQVNAKPDANTVNMLQLINYRNSQNVHFGLYTDGDIGFPNDVKFENQIIESYQDEDIDTDDDILYAGVKTCHHDLVPLARRIAMPNYTITIKNNNIAKKIKQVENPSSNPPPSFQNPPTNGFFNGTFGNG